jgi:predicted transcriptional regulator
MDALRIETVTVPLHPDLVAALERMQARVDAQRGYLTEEARAQIEAAEDRLLFGDEGTT